MNRCKRSAIAAAILSATALTAYSGASPANGLISGTINSATQLGASLTGSGNSGSASAAANAATAANAAATAGPRNASASIGAAANAAASASRVASDKPIAPEGVAVIGTGVNLGANENRLGAGAATGITVAKQGRHGSANASLGTSAQAQLSRR